MYQTVCTVLDNMKQCAQCCVIRNTVPTVHIYLFSLGRDHAKKNPNERAKLEQKLTKGINKRIEQNLIEKSEKVKKGGLNVVKKNARDQQIDVKAAKRKMKSV